jgi:hypothetical protein
MWTATRRSLVALLLVAMVAACGAGPNALLGRPTPSAVDSAAPTTSIAPGLVAEAKSIKDKKGDLVDEADDPVTKNGQVDIVKLTASADGSSLRLLLDLAGDVPAGVSSTDQQITYLFQVETDRSGTFDYWIVISNLENGAWSASITDYTEAGHGASAYGPRFPGSNVVDGRSVAVTVALQALGHPSRLRIAAAAQRADHVSGVVLAEDHAPKDTTKPSKAWLALGS